MPRFTLIKHPDSELLGDTSVTVTLSTDDVRHVREAFEDFLHGAGFALEIPDEEPEFERRLTVADKVAKEEDFMWDEAFKSKFKNGDKR